MPNPATPGKACSPCAYSPHPVLPAFPGLTVRSFRPLRGDSLTASPLTPPIPRPVGCTVFASPPFPRLLTPCRPVSTPTPQAQPVTLPIPQAPDPHRPSTSNPMLLARPLPWRISKRSLPTRHTHPRNHHPMPRLGTSLRSCRSLMPAVFSHCGGGSGYAHHHPNAHAAALTIGARGVVLLMKDTPGRLRRTLKPAAASAWQSALPTTLRLPPPTLRYVLALPWHRLALALVPPRHPLPPHRFCDSQRI